MGNTIRVLIYFYYRNVVRCCIGHKSPITCLSFAHNGFILAAGSTDGTIILWQLSGKVESEIILVLNEHKQVYYIIYSQLHHYHFHLKIFIVYHLL